MSKAAKPRVLKLRRKDQIAALSSPLRMELIGLFTQGDPLSVADIASRMGRPPSAIHYHVRVLEKAGLLRRKGQRKGARRPETLYLPVADYFQLGEERGAKPSRSAALRTMSGAFRMAERDLAAALESPSTKSEGPHRNCYGARLHCRLSRSELAELNRHLRAIDKLLTRSRKSHRPAADDSFVSLTLALLPLPNREVSS